MFLHSKGNIENKRCFLTNVNIGIEKFKNCTWNILFYWHHNLILRLSYRRIENDPLLQPHQVPVLIALEKTIHKDM